MASREVTKLLIGLLLAPLVGWLASSKRGERILMWCMTGTLFVIGATSVGTGVFVGREGSRALLGTPAVVVGSILIALALYLAIALGASRAAATRKED